MGLKVLRRLELRSTEMLNKIHIYPIFYLLKGGYGRMVKYRRGTWGTWAGTAAASACTAAPAVENRDWTSGLGIGAESLGLQSL